MKFYYIDVSLEFSNNLNNQEITPAFFKNHVLLSLKTLFGEIGASITVDLLKYNQEENRGILRVPSDYYVKLHSSLTLSGFFGGKESAFRIHKTSPLLISLIGDSRNYQH